MHIRSQAGAAVLQLIDEARRDPRQAALQPLGAKDAIEALDQAGIRRGLVLSIAYLFGDPELTVENERAKVRAENEYVAEQVALYPDRLAGACSVNPLKDYAIEEIEICHADPRIADLKLHLANSGVNLKNPAHLARLAEVFRLLGRLDMPVVVHLRTNDTDYGAADARAFIDQVLSQAPHLPVQVAHMAGWGGYDEATDAALGSFVDALADGRLEPGRITFDLAAVVFEPAAAGDDKELAARVRRANQRLAERIRAIGPGSVVFATDWPSWPPTPDPAVKLTQNVRLVRHALPLAPQELAQVFSNVNVLAAPEKRAMKSDG